MSAKKKLLRVNYPVDQIPDVERRKDELGFKTLSDYLKDLIARDLASPVSPTAHQLVPLPPPPPPPKKPWRDAAVLTMWFFGVLWLVRAVTPPDASEVTCKYVEIPAGERPLGRHHRRALRLVLTDLARQICGWFRTAPSTPKEEPK